MGTARSPSQSPTKSSPSPTFHEYLEDQTHADFASGENEANFMAKKSVSMFNSDTHSRTKKRSIENIMPEDHMSYEHEKFVMASSFEFEALCRDAMKN